MFGTSSPDSKPDSADSSHARTWAEDPTALFVKASLPSGRIIGFGKWNILTDLSAPPRNPYPADEPMPGGNAALRKWFFDALNQKRLDRLAGKKHFLMAILVVDPEFQRMGVGKKLLQWGLAMADEQGVECWIDASPFGKGLYEKMGWKEISFVEVDLGKWGGEEGVTTRTVNMLRLPGAK